MADEPPVLAARRSPPELEFRALAEAAPDSIVTGDAHGRNAYANPAAERLFGRPAGELVGQSIAVLMPERLRAAHRRGYARFLATGRARLVGSTVDVVGLRADGTEFPAELSLGSAGTGARRTFTAVLRDATERRRRERHLAAQLAVTSVLAGGLPAEETQPRLVESLTRALGWDIGLLWRLDADGRLRVHHAWQAEPESTGAFVRASLALSLEPGAGLPGATLGAEQPVWIDDLLASSVPLRLDAAVASGLRAAICLPLVVDAAPTGVVELFTREVLPVDDELRDLLMTVASQLGEHLGRLEAQARLAEARERHAADLERSNSELEHFAHIAAHDLRTPLLTISGFADLLVRRHGDALPAEAHEALGMIRESAQASGRLLDNLLSYARTGGAGAEHAPVDVRAVIGEVLVALRADVVRHGAEVEVEELPPVLADRVGLAQVLQNLLANAMKFTPSTRRPRVTVTGRTEGAWVRLDVADEGVGVPEEAVAGLFAMFDRGVHGGRYEGAGIGLAVSARVVERHGGRIWVEPRPDGGSVFSFTLPAAAPPPDP